VCPFPLTAKPKGGKGRVCGLHSLDNEAEHERLAEGQETRRRGSSLRRLSANQLLAREYGKMGCPVRRGGRMNLVGGRTGNARAARGCALGRKGFVLCVMLGSSGEGEGREKVTVSRRVTE